MYDFQSCGSIFVAVLLNSSELNVELHLRCNIFVQKHPESKAKYEIIPERFVQSLSSVISHSVIKEKASPTPSFPHPWGGVRRE